MNNFYIRLLFILLASVLSNSGFSATGSKKVGTGSSIVRKVVTIIRTYSGICFVKTILPYKQYKVIRSRRQFLYFKKNIPANKTSFISKSKYTDPLIKIPRINFKKFMLVIAISPNPRRYKPPVILRVIESASRIYVFYKLPYSSYSTLKLQVGFGYYYAALIKRSQKIVKFYVR